MMECVSVMHDEIESKEVERKKKEGCFRIKTLSQYDAFLGMWIKLKMDQILATNSQSR